MITEHNGDDILDRKQN